MTLGAPDAWRGARCRLARASAPCGSHCPHLEPARLTYALRLDRPESPLPMNRLLQALAPPRPQCAARAGACEGGRSGPHMQYSDFSMVGGMGLISVPSSCSMR